MILKLDNITRVFGGIHAVRSVSLDVAQGSIIGLIGPNGAGKTTLFNLIAGSINPTAGTIHFKGVDVTSKPGFERAQLGIARTFQVPRLFKQLTVIENILVVIDRPVAKISGAFMPGAHRRRNHSVSRAMEVLSAFNLDKHADEWARSLSGGQQKLLTFAQLAVGDAELVLLDEPAAGVNPAIVQNLAAQVKKLNESGKTVFVVEHNLKFIEMITQHIFVMAEGKLMFQGSMSDIRSSAAVREAYIGKTAVRNTRGAAQRGAGLNAV